MSRKLQNRVLTVFTAAAAILVLSATPCFAAVFYLRTEQFTKTMPDGEDIIMWGFAPDVDNNFIADTNATTPGPFLSVDTDDPNIIIHLKNNLAVPVSIVIPGLVTTMKPVFFNDSTGRRRVRSFTHETGPNTIGMYTWNNLKDGSFIYESGTHQAVQVQMGLYGGLKIEADPNVPYTEVPVDYEANLFFSEIDPALHEAVAMGTYGSVNPNLITENFDVDTGTFTYLDDAFRSTSEPAYADGNYIAAGGFSGGALKIDLGGIDGATILGFSGGWTKSFDMSSSESVNISFRYKLTQSPNYEPDEHSEVLVSIDGGLIGSGGNDYVARITGNGEGGPDITTGWLQFSVNTGVLAAGTHTIIIGGYNNKKTWINESTEVLIDDVLVSRDINVTMTSTIGYDPKYFLINGQPYPQSSVFIAAGASGGTTLVRFYNAGLQTHVPVVQGLYMNIIAEDGFTYQFPKRQYSLSLTAGKTKDATIAPSQDAFYPLYDRALNLTNAAAQPGGMLALLNVGNLNFPPAISLLSATPAEIFSNETSQLLVVATDPDSQPSPLSYLWIVQPGSRGTITNPTTVNPAYIPPNDVVGIETFTIVAAVSDGQDTTNSTIDISVQNSTVLSENFISDAGSFSYADNTFRNTTELAYADGTYTSTEGFVGGGLKVNLAGIDGSTVVGMSGGWVSSFNLISDSIVTISLRYNLTQTPNYEPDEHSEVLVSIDGALIGSGGNDYVARITGNGEGGPSITTGWQQFNVDTAILSAGAHTLSIGAYNNKKTWTNESTEMLIDDVEVLVAP